MNLIRSVLALVVCAGLACASGGNQTQPTDPINPPGLSSNGARHYFMFSTGAPTEIPARVREKVERTTFVFVGARTNVYVASAGPWSSLSSNEQTEVRSTAVARVTQALALRQAAKPADVRAADNRFFDLSRTLLVLAGDPRTNAVAKLTLDELRAVSRAAPANKRDEALGLMLDILSCVGTYQAEDPRWYKNAAYHEVAP